MGGALTGLAQTGDALATIWMDTSQAVAGAIGGALEATVGVASPSLFDTGESIALGFQDAASALAQTGGNLATSVEVALTDLGLSLQAALNASLGIGIAA